MGQRHQIFVRVINPVHVIKANKRKPTPEQIAQFGTKKTTVLAFHNQWLYGRSALMSALGMLNFAAQVPKDSKINPNPKDSYCNHPLTYKAIDYQYRNQVDMWLAHITMVLNFIPVNTDALSAGFNSSFYLNDDDPEIRHEFDRGDNNDGITIIDTIENKYCFMNISNSRYNPVGKNNNVDDLPYMVPSSAADYVRAYYGETLETISDYKLDPERLAARNETPEMVVAANVAGNAKLIAQFEPYTILTEKEILAIFPKMAATMADKTVKVLYLTTNE